MSQYVCNDGTDLQTKFETGNLVHAHFSDPSTISTRNRSISYMGDIPDIAYLFGYDSPTRYRMAGSYPRSTLRWYNEGRRESIAISSLVSYVRVNLYMTAGGGGGGSGAPNGPIATDGVGNDGVSDSSVWLNNALGYDALSLGGGKGGGGGQRYGSTRIGGAGGAGGSAIHTTGGLGAPWTGVAYLGDTVKKGGDGASSGVGAAAGEATTQLSMSDGWARTIPGYPGGAAGTGTFAGGGGAGGDAGTSGGRGGNYTVGATPNGSGVAANAVCGGGGGGAGASEAFLIYAGAGGGGGGPGAKALARCVDTRMSISASLPASGGAGVDIGHGQSGRGGNGCPPYIYIYY